MNAGPPPYSPPTSYGGKGDDLRRAQGLLDSLRRRQLTAERHAAVALTTGVVSVLWLTVGLLEASLHLPPLGRVALSATALLISVTVAAAIWWRLSRDLRLRPGRAADQYWALRLGDLTPHTLRDRLLNALQIAQGSAASRENPSTALAAEALYRAVASVDKVDALQANDFSGRSRALRTGGAAVVALVAALAMRPVVIGSSVIRLLHPFTDYTPPPAFTLSVTPAGGWVYRSESVEFVISADGVAPTSVEFAYRQSGGDEVAQDVRLTDGRGAIAFDGFPMTISYLVRRDRVTTSPYRLDVIARPQIVELSYKLLPPAYTRLPSIVGRENSGDIEALPGSAVELSVRASKELADALLVMSRAGDDTLAADTLPMEVSGAEAKLRFKVQREGGYVVRLVDKGGHRDRDPVQYRIHLLTDEPPAVRIPFPDVDVVLGDDMVVPLRIEADDDYGLQRLELNYRKLEAPDSTVQRWPLGSSRNARSIALDTLWALGDLALMPGDVVEYWAAAWDNDDVRGPKRSESARRLVRLPTFEEIVAGVEQIETEATLDTKKALDAAKELREEVSKLVEQMRRDPNADWERQKQIEQSLTQQEKLSQQAEQLSKTLDELARKLDRHDLLTPETLEKYQELQKLMAEVASPELKEAMEKLRQAMASQDPEKIRQALEQFDMDREQFLQNIERSLSILQQLKLERKLDELAKRAEELLHAQEQVLKNLDEGRTDDAARSLESQAQRADALRREMEETRQLAEQATASEVAKSLDSLASARTIKEMPAAMRGTASAATSGRSGEAKSAGEESARDLAELSAALDQLAESFKEHRKADLAAKLRRLVEELLYVSRAQEELQGESRLLGTQSPRYRDLAGAQQDVREALAGIAGRTFELSKETFFVTPELGASLGRGLQQVDRALEGFSDRTPRSAVAPQKQALGEVNRSAAQLLAILQQLQGSSSSSGYEELMQKLSEMASAQQGLNQSMPIPGQGEGSLPTEGGSLSQLAAQQRALQQQMEQAAEEARGIEEMLGDLQGIADAMGDVAKDMENQQLTERTRRLQQQIVSRLLDATRSAREEEYSKKRESKTGVDVVRKPASPAQFQEAHDRLRRDLLRALQEGYTPDYRKLIRDYYEALER